MSETKAAPLQEAIRRDGNDVYFPIPVFMGDGKEWSINLFQNKWLWLRDLRAAHWSQVGLKDLKVEVNGRKHELPVNDEMVIARAHHIRVKTIKGEPFTLLLSDQPLILHMHVNHDLPLSESVSVNSEEAAARIVNYMERLDFVRRLDYTAVVAEDWIAPRVVDSSSR